MVTITDPDANHDPDIADSIREIRVFSESDAVGEEFSAIETGRNTGEFRLSFTTSTESQGNAIMVRNDDTLSVAYTDEFPADTNAVERTNIFSIAIISEVGFIIDPSPLLSDIIGTLKTGNQMTLSVNLTSYNDQPQPFVQIIEVRSTDGITVFLAWQGGTLGPLGKTEVGVLWTPDQPGNYMIRTFAFTDFENPQVLSIVQESEFAIV